MREGLEAAWAVEPPAAEGGGGGGGGGRLVRDAGAAGNAGEGRTAEGGRQQRENGEGRGPAQLTKSMIDLSCSPHLYGPTSN